MLNACQIEINERKKSSQNRGSSEIITGSSIADLELMYPEGLPMYIISFHCLHTQMRTGWLLIRGI